ncbi:7-carboxy-7-deazaguanine synthase QueE [Flavobacterium sp. xlx-214]|uniref:7-carboxy-7-deazaguanine synthase QueE n=1 Tax=unclassified Flavobacterium TaxID=196869 RepID=UPI0013CF8D54|nr:MULTISPECIES: 7-carboxy-7-deazaguanine synthase QueE [unclassified Flavobacterium]MBA5792791.1 7-carboxy-7-deazaguanine synthase QueE [Flavobacterium sp. xlx-221]QMI83928.1 7-carboxy-7-deazaguanine synthase QueE [Flavobacterium sp. xlx-214]
MTSTDKMVTALPLMEAFYTIQGEGFYTGHAAYFIRLAGCDVGCHWCDVKESWDQNLHPTVTVDAIVAEAEKHGNLVVITGGEPLMWNLDFLTQQLQLKGIKTNIETSGAYELSGTWDWICLSPKKTKLPTQSVYDAANELKCIIYNNHDFVFAEEQAARVNKNAKLYLQVEWGKKDEMLPAVIDYVKNNPKWVISTQTHKYLDIP